MRMVFYVNHGGLQADLKGGSGGAAAPPVKKTMICFSCCLCSGQAEAASLDDWLEVIRVVGISDGNIGNIDIYIYIYIYIYIILYIYILV